MRLDLTGKIALVTGSTGQLGRVIARTLADCGADIALHYINNQAQAEELRQQIEAAGRKALTVQGDITKEETSLRIRDEILAGLGPVDIVVANAVIQYAWTTVLEQSPQDYMSQFESCVMQSVYLAKAFIPHMKEAGSGRFIGINTECAMQNFATQSAYTAGKRGMDGLYRVLAREVGEHQITVNQVAPGWTISDRDRAAEPGYDQAYADQVPLKRRGEDQEIANAVAFLASDLSSFITGAYIPVSGGNVMPAI
ncbi:MULTISPECIES: SDR family NAD(P)-dependent oxidoreductase [Paenibacillus]|uniref:SDR family NAD(P)-dependent oxidoreductase n=1 Tax=Paenibacillus TaxID=44249 RepID=UPI001F441EA4|nr:SDR family oxidoreductase [Paenibacillus sp. JJ-223]CAH1199591.1 3-oxoacyl-[acyl-carrier-protein] reductase FabG [Paenibacillus sp. JJ-223]